MPQKRIFSFGGGKAEGNKDMKETLGGKGAGLAEMSNIGIPVPPGFTITTEVCTEYYRSGRKLPRAVRWDCPTTSKVQPRRRQHHDSRDGAPGH